MAYESPHRKTNRTFPQPDDPKVRVWRYLDLPRFIWMLATHALTFARVDTLEDPFEGSIPPEVFDEWKSNPAAAAVIERARNGLRRQTFVSCWHTNNVESEAMWRLYCGSRDGIALQTTYEKLDASLPPEILLGQVTYLDYDNDKEPPVDELSLLMRKRQAFEHEHEIRALIPPNGHSAVTSSAQPAGQDAVINVPWAANEHLEHIYVSPYAEEWYRDVVVAVLDRFAPELRDRLQWSHMRGVPLY